MFSKITVNLLQDEASPGSFSRGQEYYRKDKPRNLAFDPEGDFVSASVRGRRAYTVVIESISSNPVFFCTCPVVDDLCKHAVAVGLKIINEPESVKTLVKPESRKKLLSLDSLFKKTSPEQKSDFLYDVLSENDYYLKRFETMVLGQMAVESAFSIDSIRESVKDDIEAHDFSDMDTLYYEDNSAFGRYRDEWEIMLDNAENELEGSVDTYTSRAREYLEAGNVIDGTKVFIGLFQGILMADQEKLNDELDVLGDCFESILIEYFLTFQVEFIERFNTVEKQDKVLMRISQLMERQMEYFCKIANKRRENPGNYIFMIKPFICHLIATPDVARFWEDILRKYGLDDLETDEIQLKIAAVTGNPGAWLQIAEKNYQSNPIIARQLLECYRQEQKNADFIRIGQHALTAWGDQFDAYLSQYVEYSDDPELHTGALSHLALRTESLELFNALRNTCGEKTALEFVDKVRKEISHHIYYVNLLEEIEDYPSILSFVKANLHDYHFSQYITPILNVYPAECFSIIRKKTDAFLKQKVSRRYYQITAHWLKLLFKIKDKAIQTQSRQYIDFLLVTYKRRSALHQEFKEAGLY